MASKKYFKLYCVLHSSSNENWFALSINTVLATKFQTDFNSTLLFFWKLFEAVLPWHNFFQDIRHVQTTFQYIKTDTYIFYGPYTRGKLVIVYRINAPLWYKPICNESESRIFGCQWTLVSFLMKRHANRGRLLPRTPGPVPLWDLQVF